MGSVRSNENEDFKMHFFADQAVVRVISRRDKGTRPSRARSLELEQLQFLVRWLVFRAEVEVVERQG
jgi:hypothetical protein